MTSTPDIPIEQLHSLFYAPTSHLSENQPHLWIRTSEHQQNFDSILWRAWIPTWPFPPCQTTMSQQYISNPATHSPSRTFPRPKPLAAMDPDLARALFQNNNISTPKPSHRHPIQHHRCSNSAPRRSDANQHFAPRPPPPDPSSSHPSSELMKVLYHTPGIQTRDYHITIAVCMQFLVTQ
jgi:hypothetical protein